MNVTNTRCSKRCSDHFKPCIDAWVPPTVIAARADGSAAHPIQIASQRSNELRKELAGIRHTVSLDQSKLFGCVSLRLPNTCMERLGLDCFPDVVLLTKRRRILFFLGGDLCDIPPWRQQFI